MSSQYFLRMEVVMQCDFFILLLSLAFGNRTITCKEGRS